MAKHSVSVNVTTSGNPAAFINDKVLGLRSGDGKEYQGETDVQDDEITVEFQCRGLNGTKWALKVIVDDADKPSCEKSRTIKNGGFDRHICKIAVAAV